MQERIEKREKKKLYKKCEAKEKREWEIERQSKRGTKQVKKEH